MASTPTMATANPGVRHRLLNARRMSPPTLLRPRQFDELL
jgi:hypothetical protein